MIMKMIKHIFIILFVLNLNSVFAKGSRVIEVQEKIKQDISDFLEKFAPRSKYSVKVKVKPLRRTSNNSSQDDSLPFMEFEENMALDEWDDPTLNVYSLYNRIAEAKISIFLDDKVSIEDRQKFKEALLSDVNLISGRDSITIESISTPVLKKGFNWEEQTQTLLLGVMLIIAVILGVGLNSLAKKVSPGRGANDIKNSSPANNTPIASSAPSQVMRGAESNREKFSELRGDLNIQDPTKINEIVGSKIEKLLSSDLFPLLSDMVILEDLLKVDPLSFSYLVYEFPQDVQKTIYELGRGEKWFKGFSEVGFPSKIVITSLDKMLRNRDVNHSENFERLLIYTWRLTNHLKSFIKKMPKDQAFALLYHLPKDISIPISRDCFPGSWGGILEGSSSSNFIETKEIQLSIVEALKIQPYFNYESLQVFKNRKDLLSYLDTVEPHEEKDIYSVMGEENDLNVIRPPFYKFFDLDQESRSWIYKKFSLEEWAIACFNIERNDKDLIVELMDDKEKYLFSHALKRIDENPQLAIDKVEIRHKVATIIFDKNEREVVNKIDDVQGSDESVEVA